MNPHIEDVTRRFAAAGYHAVAPDMFHRTGGGVVDYGDFGAVIEHFIGIGSDDAILADVDATLDYLRGLGFADRQIGIVGFCFGGRVSFLVAPRSARSARRSASTAAASSPPASRSSRRSSTGAATHADTPWLGLFGDPTSRSRSTTSSSCASALTRRAGRRRGRPLRRRRARLPLRRAPGVQRRRPRPTRGSRTLEWFARHLGAS